MSTWRARLAHLAPAVGVGILLLADPVDDGPTICPFALATGIACPGCGMTRALVRLFHGDMAGAVEYHPLAPAALAGFLAGWTWWTLARKGVVRPVSANTIRFATLGGALSLLAVWLVRLSAGTLPPV